MRITDIKIDGFGVWNELSLRRLSPGLTVFYGPNEAGKSTLMQFLRSVLYGVSPARRERYLPPVAGGRPGGWLKVEGDNGPLTIRRYADRGPEDVGKVTVVTAAGEKLGDRLLRETLENVDEPTYNNVFAVGLREVQELGTLSDTAAAQWLYRLTSGLDRVSLYDVIRMLERTRLRLLSSPAEESELRTLTSRREQLRAELDELVAKGRRWAQSAVQLRELADEVERRQEETKSLAARARRLEVAIGLKPQWTERGKIDDQLQRYRDLRPLEEGTLAALDDLNERIAKHQRQRDVLKGQRHQLRDEAARLGINDKLIRNAHRLEALLEQQDWMQGVERMAAELADEVKQLETRLQSEQERLAHQWTGAGSLPPRITREVVESAAPQARAIEATKGLLEAAQHELEMLRANEHQFRAQIESAMTGGDALGLPKDLEAAGDLVGRLRQRQSVEKRLANCHRQADELQQQAREMVGEQVVPVGLFSWLLAVFVLGSVGLGAWWIVPAGMLGPYGGLFACLGLGGAIFAWLLKFFLERASARRFDACRAQLELVSRQLAEAQEEQARLDRELPLTGGSVAMRLGHAERHLAELERTLPVESQRREAAETIAATEQRVASAAEKYAAAVANWKDKLQALGLPQPMSPASLSTMADEWERLAELETRIANRRDELTRRQRESAAVAQRIAALVEEAGLGWEAPSDEAVDAKTVVEKNLSPLEQLHRLQAEYHQHKHRLEQRQTYRRRAKELKANEQRHARAAHALRHRRAVLFERCGVADELELRQLSARLDEAAKLRKQRAAITREIAAAIGRQGSEEDFAPLLAPEAFGRLESDWEAVAAEHEARERELQEILQRRGALVEQQRAAAADHSLAARQIKLDVLEQQIEEAAVAWRERAAVSLLLERIRQDYENHRQPETLREASGYLQRLTAGRYTRVWTPLGHDVLLVDTANGQQLAVQLLSRGTREQLFVSLRLALVSAFARRGVRLPMILDDVLANFDADRTRAACSVLREFAEQGHQVLVFTCHEHVWRMFKELNVDSRRLPNRLGKGEHVVAEPEPAAAPSVATPVEAVAAVPPEEKSQPTTEPPPEPEPSSHSDEVEYREVEYRWDNPPAHETNGKHGEAVQRVEPVKGWLPEPVIHPRPW